MKGPVGFSWVITTQHADFIIIIFFFLQELDVQ